MSAAVRIVRWGEGDGPLLHALLGDPEMTKYLGGPESPEKIDGRQKRYEETERGLFKIVDEEGGEGVGWVGWWEREWRDQDVWEIGWSVLPAFQGRGIAVAATSLALDATREEGSRRSVHAFPSVENGPSNAICRKLGFELIEVCDFEYPPGTPLRCNDWRFDLLGATTAA